MFLSGVYPLLAVRIAKTSKKSQNFQIAKRAILCLTKKEKSCIGGRWLLFANICLYHITDRRRVQGEQ